ncbi:hypothetical protein OIO07_03365 [Bacillus paralicheniformis]|uniref:hypothetical protein n=1 Tax=Bacillus paralicheniformis TaxID=1648923 RepID=UPI0004725A92|nr:hypothetical protein [Bacillus paralicheniformis]MBG9882737.1 hypothetical protein [Bacillus paralicheniformis]MCV9367307.1 hypothetical protein [Bacillus paralicheniformis]TWJ77705.1 hypothetical protein CHCC20497_2418 [Bacillus paralicheniformis]UAL15303.1 hypothetical protein KY997_05290 [Bacillus paralicheniformis]UAL27906.1 hypothetical protein KY998_11315 [Bacillus paralicheniformis]
MSEIKRPVITKEQAEAIEQVRRWGHGDVLSGRPSTWGYSICELDKMDMLTLAAALINGYEVEKTPEEKVREYYAANYQRHEQSMPRSKDDFYTSGVAEGVRNTLDSLGIKIEGVNA